MDPASDPSFRKVVHRALLSAGSDVVIVTSKEEVDEALAGSSFDLTLANYDSPEAEAKTYIRDYLGKEGKTPLILLSQRRDKDHLVELFSHDQLRNLIARNEKVSEEEVIITTEKLLRQDIFGLEKYLVWGVNLVQEVVQDSAEKQDQVQRVGDFVRNLQCDKRFVRLAEIVADELLMNALYDAPVDDDGKSMYAHLPRTDRVQLKAKDRAILEYGSDGRYFAIACRDRFGALKGETVVSYLRKCFAADEYQIDTKAGGAGVGFYMIFQSLNQLVVNIHPGKMTETLGLIDIRASYRDTKSRSKSFNIFVKQE